MSSDGGVLAGGVAGPVPVQDVVLAGVCGHVLAQPRQLRTGRADLGVDRVGAPAVPDVPGVVHAAVDAVRHVLHTEVARVPGGATGAVLVVARRRVGPVLEGPPGRVVPLRVGRLRAVGIGVVARGEHRVGIRGPDQICCRGGVLLVAGDIPRAHDRDRGVRGRRRRAVPPPLRRRDGSRRIGFGSGARRAARRREEHSRHEGRRPQACRHPGVRHHGVPPPGRDATEGTHIREGPARTGSGFRRSTRR
jgi:hypothetical protein